MEKDKLTAEKVNTLGVVGGIIFTLIMGGVAGYYYFNYLQRKKEVRKQQDYQLRLEKDARRLKELIKGYKEERKRFEEILFNKQDIAAFLEEVSQFAKKSKIKIVDMKTRRFSEIKVEEEIQGGASPLAQRGVSSSNNKKKGAVLFSLPIEVRAEGMFSSIVNFLIFLERSRQLTTVSNINIKMKNYPLLDCSFVLRLYSLKNIEEKE